MGRTENNPRNSSPKQNSLLEKIDQACDICVQELSINYPEKFNRKNLIYEICRQGVRQEPRLREIFYAIDASAAGVNLDNFDEKRKRNYQNLSNLLNDVSASLRQRSSEAAKGLSLIHI